MTDHISHSENLRMAAIEARREAQLLYEAEHHPDPDGPMKWSSEVWNEGIPKRLPGRKLPTRETHLPIAALRKERSR
jgi:hypothetical protein